MELDPNERRQLERELGRLGATELELRSQLFRIRYASKEHFGTNPVTGLNPRGEHWSGLKDDAINRLLIKIRNVQDQMQEVEELLDSGRIRPRTPVAAPPPRPVRLSRFAPGGILYDRRPAGGHIVDRGGNVRNVCYLCGAPFDAPKEGQNMCISCYEACGGDFAGWTGKSAGLAGRSRFLPLKRFQAP